MAELDAGKIVDAVDLVDPEALHHAFVAHHLGPATFLFCRLKNQRDLAREIPRFHQILCCPQ